MGRSREGEESVKAFEETDVAASIAAPTTAARAPLDTDRESMFLSSKAVMSFIRLRTADETRIPECSVKISRLSLPTATNQGRSRLARGGVSLAQR